MMMNVGNPELAFSLSALPNEGVGLARMEFIIANHIQVHPLALVNFDTLADGSAKRKIAKLTARYDDKPQYFVDKLAQGIGTIARGLLSQARGGAPVGLQEQRIRQPAGGYRF
jgi:pyruvate,water dikinase